MTDLCNSPARIRARPNPNLRVAMEKTTREFIRSFYGGDHVLHNPKFSATKLTPTCACLIVPRATLTSLPPSSYSSTISLPPTLVVDDDDEAEAEAEAAAAAAAEVAGEEWKATDPKVCGIRNTVILDLTIDEGVQRSVARSVHVIGFVDGEEMALEYSWFFELVDEGRLIRKAVQFCGEGTRMVHEKRLLLVRGASAKEEEGEGEGKGKGVVTATK
ncbi:hypothetical protein F5Y12DRAFT_487506 [Xylaria sp. FL1777]|nr:hypothetical protein F5Y12DRAFT_487506 [Xylaria sp. FL1777]